MEIVTHEYVANTKRGRHENVRVLRKEIKKVLRWESGWMWRWSNKKGFEYNEQRKVTMNGKKREHKYENCQTGDGHAMTIVDRGQ